MDTKYMVISAIGKDRIGLAEIISEEIVTSRCNVEESKMSVLGGEFAIILLVSGFEPDLDRIIASQPQLESRLDMIIHFRKTEAPVQSKNGMPYILESVSMDTPGIMHSITKIIARYGINVEELETSTTQAPWTGAPMFRMRARLTVPATVAIVRLREEFGKASVEKDLDITLIPDLPSF